MKSKTYRDARVLATPVWSNESEIGHIYDRPRPSN